MAKILARYMTGMLGNSKALSEEDIDQALENVCRPPAPTSIQNLKPVIAAESFVRISGLLQALQRHGGRKDWNLRPRIYTVLRAIGRQDAMDAFVQQGLYDLHLPFDLASLPSQLGSHKLAFRDYQTHVCTQAKDLEDPRHGQHLNFTTSGDHYFKPANGLGSGGFSTVDVVLSRLSWRFYARKRILRGGRRDEQFRTYNREINALKRLRHHHLVQIIGTCTDPRYFTFLMLPIADENLRHYLDRVSKDRNLLSDLRSFYGCLASTITYLHHQRIYHMDLKLENILILHGRIYVSDFGAAHDWSFSERSTTHTPAPAWTQRYIPPELAKNPTAPRNAATDMWSLGVVLLEMTSVLRGKTVDGFRKFLHNNNSKSRFVYSNLGATASWAEVLQTAAAGSSSDNEPLVWIKDLLQERQHLRASAQTLLQEILRSPYVEQWRGICCADPENSDLQDLTVEATNGEMGMRGQPEVFPSPKPYQLAITSKTRTIFNWQQDIVAQSIVPGAWTDDEESSQVGVSFEVTDDETDCDVGTLDKDRGQSYSQARNTDLSYTPWDVTEDLTEVVGHHEDPLTDQYTEKLAEFAFLDQPPPDYVPNSGHLGDYEHDDVFEVDDDGDDDDDDGGDQNLHKHGHDYDNDDTNFSISSDESEITVRPPPSIEPTDDATEFVSIVSEQRMDAAPDAGQDFLLKSNESAGPSSVNQGKANPNSNWQDPVGAETSSVEGLIGNSKPKKLTIKNLDALNLAQPVPDATPLPLPESGVSGLGISAREYIEQVYQTESSAATSRMSTNTKEKLGLQFGLTKWLDKDHDLLGRYARLGQASAVRECLIHNCNPGTKKKRRPGPLLAAVNGGTQRHNKCVRALLEYGANPDVKRRGKPALHIAIEHNEFKGYTSLIMELLLHGADPNATDTSGDTALLKILLGSLEPLSQAKRDAMALLMHYQANVHIGPQGTLQKPIHLAVRRNDPWAVSFLLHNGALPSEKDSAGRTPFALAAGSLKGKASLHLRETLAQLLKYGADVNEQIGAQQNTALHLATTAGDEAVIRLLVSEYFANAFIKNAKGLTSLDTLQDAHKNKKVTDTGFSTLKDLLSTANEDRTKPEFGSNSGSHSLGGTKQTRPAAASKGTWKIF